MSMDMTSLNRKLAENIGEPVVVTYGTRGPRMPAAGIICAPRVFVSDEGIRAFVPTKVHAAFDMVTRMPRIIEDDIPIDSIVRFLPEHMLDKLIRVGRSDIRTLLSEMEHTLAEGPGGLVDIQGADEHGHAMVIGRTLDPLWQAAHERSVAAFEATIKAEMAMITTLLRVQFL